MFKIGIVVEVKNERILEKIKELYPELEVNSEKTFNEKENDFLFLDCEINKFDESKKEEFTKEELKEFCLLSVDLEYEYYTETFGSLDFGKIMATSISIDIF